MPVADAEDAAAFSCVFKSGRIRYSCLRILTQTDAELTVQHFLAIRKMCGILVSCGQAA